MNVICWADMQCDCGQCRTFCRREGKIDSLFRVPRVGAEKGRECGVRLKEQGWMGKAEGMR